MKLLALETSSGLLSIAGFEDGSLKLELSRDALMRQNENLAPLVAELLNTLNWKASELGALAVSLGPGSFTGLRTGLAFAKGLSYANGAILIGISTLEAWAEGEDEAEVWLDARRGFVYRAAYKKGILIKEAQMLPMEEARRELSPGMKLLGDLQDLKGLPSAAKLGRLAWERVKRGERDDPASLEPSYLRRAEAEILWEKRQEKSAGGTGAS